MIRLDVLGAACPLLFLLAMETRSILFVYAITLLQQSVTSLYEPCRSSLPPLLVSNEDELKTATTVLGLSWSVFAALGSSLGGTIVSTLGLRACFVVDCVTYLASAAFLLAMGGDWSTSAAKKYASASLCDLIKDMTVDGVQYLWHSPWGSLVFLKAPGSLVNGASAILNVSFSEQSSGGGDSALRLGGLFACVGIGSFVGSLIVSASADMKQPSAVQKAAISGLGLSVVGCLGTGLFHPFLSICFFSVVRSTGTSVYWINASLLIQKFSAPEMLGRVSAMDGALALLTEASSSLFCGFLQDHWVEQANDIALIMATVGAFFVAIWSLYHAIGGGAVTTAAEQEKASFTEETSPPVTQCRKDCYEKEF